MDIFEDAVLTYISAAPGRFVSPQFTIAYENGIGGSCPDFVVLDFQSSTIYVAEVTVATNPATIFSRVLERETRWFAPLRNDISKLGAVFTSWKYRVTLFIREEVCDSLRKKTAKMPDVSVISLDTVVFPWRWHWQGQVAVNPLE
ncbi:MAG: hypothetical protein HQK76_20985 [Desulfobacterales bacterium]|nr:hypothetical protein [Desulfobacterales bacterium]